MFFKLMIDGLVGVVYVPGALQKKLEPMGVAMMANEKMLFVMLI